LPSESHFLPGYEASAWYGFVAPKDTPKEIIDTLNNATNAVLAEAAVHRARRDFVARLGGRFRKTAGG
jgi:tripartite-type tricarboxylate transporter receptor subunit TctC